MRFMRRVTAVSSGPSVTALSLRGMGSSTATLMAPYRPRRTTTTQHRNPINAAAEDGNAEDIPFGMDISKSGGPQSGGSPFTPRGGGGGGFSGGPSSGSSLAPKAHLQETPTKDRMPPATYNPKDPRRRLAVLIDGSRVDAATYASVIEPSIFSFGVPVICRVFDTELRDGWLELVEPSTAVIGATLASSSSSATLHDNSRSDSPHRNLELNNSANRTNIGVGTSLRRLGSGASSTSNTKNDAAIKLLNGARLPKIEWFRMDRFIPINVQMAADAQHLFDMKSGNKTEGVVFVCSEAERATLFEKYFGRLSGKGYTQISMDERGAGMTVIEDGRTGDGSGGWTAGNHV